ncbi:hypothetical protein [Sinorhizobium fredii]|uniref:hypothetical protein n=1 Tax=Rhizobium fredii TaxID=380 RepID=UPI00351964C9
MADAARMMKLIEDCQQDIAAYLPKESYITEHELLQKLITRLDGRQAREALGDDWRRWWPDDDPDDGGDAGASRSNVPEST